MGGDSGDIAERYCISPLVAGTRGSNSSGRPGYYCVCNDPTNITRHRLRSVDAPDPPWCHSQESTIVVPPVSGSKFAKLGKKIFVNYSTIAPYWQTNAPGHCWKWDSSWSLEFLTRLNQNDCGRAFSMPFKNEMCQKRTNMMKSFCAQAQCSADSYIAGQWEITAADGGLHPALVRWTEL